MKDYKIRKNLTTPGAGADQKHKSVTKYLSNFGNCC